MAVDANGNTIPDSTPNLMSSASSLVSPATAQAVGVGGSLASGALTANAINSAAGQLQTGLQTAENTIQTSAQPYETTGAAANAQLAAGLKSGGQFNTPFTMDNAATSAAEQYAKTTGIDALQNSAIAKGGLLGTNGIVGVEDFAAKNAAQFENQAFNQDLSTKAATMGGLENLSSTGANVSTAAGGNIAGLQSQGAQAGMNATLGAANQYNQAVQNAISAYTALSPTGAPTSTSGSAGAATNPAATAITNAVNGIPNGAGGTTGTGTVSGMPAGAVINPATGQPAVNTPQQIASGTAVPTQTVDPAQRGAINMQNGTPAATTSPVSQGSAQTTNLPAQNAGPNQVVDPQQAAQNQQIAAAAGVTPTGSVGTSVGDTSPTGGIIIPSDTGLPAVDSTTGAPVLAFNSFDSLLGISSTTPTISGDLSSLMSTPIDPTAEFLATPAADLGSVASGLDLANLNLGATGTDFTTALDTSTPMTMDTAALDPAIIP